MDKVISANYLAALDKCLIRLGIHDFLPSMGFDSLTIQNPEAYLSTQQVRDIVKKAYEVSQCSELGFLFGEQLSIVNHGFLGFAVMSSHTWLQAIEVVSSFLNTRVKVLQLGLEYVDENRVCLTLIPLIDDPLLSRFITEVILVHLIKMRTFLLGTLEPCLKIELNYAEPDYKVLYQQLCQSEVQFMAESTRLWVSRKELDLPLNYADEQSFQLAKRHLEEITTHLSNKQDLISQIKNLVLNQDNYSITMDEVANQLYMTSRTLRRHLQKQAVSYQQLVDEARFEQAKALLLDNRQSLTEIGYQLGFNDVSNFSKAFKRWAGQTPSEYRLVQRFSEHNQ